MVKLSILMVGHPAAALELGAQASAIAGCLHRVPDPDAAKAYLAESTESPDLIVLAEARPGQFSPAAVDALRKLAPLARVWRMLGTWCEGETRSGKPPAGCSAAYWHQWPARFARELAAASDARWESWSLPVTATSDERALAVAQQPVAAGSGVVVVYARHTQTAQALRDVCRLGRYRPVIVTEVGRISADGAVAVLWDAQLDQIADERVTSRLLNRARGVPLIALVSFPRAKDLTQAEQRGIAAVISKPYLVQDLLWQIARLATSRAAC